MRNLLPFFDLDDKRTEFEKGDMTVFLVIQVTGVGAIQVAFNFINEYKYSAILSMCTTVISASGTYRMIYHEDGNLNAILIEHKRLGSLVQFCLSYIITLSFLHYFLNFG